MKSARGLGDDRSVTPTPKLKPIVLWKKSSISRLNTFMEEKDDEPSPTNSVSKSINL